MELDETIHVDKEMNPQRFDSDPTDFRIWINPEIQSRIPEITFGWDFALAEVCAL